MEKIDGWESVCSIVATEDALELVLPAAREDPSDAEVESPKVLPWVVRMWGKVARAVEPHLPTRRVTCAREELCVHRDYRQENVGVDSVLALKTGERFCWEGRELLILISGLRVKQLS